MSTDIALMSARAYAKRRGVDPKTVRQAIAEGRCPAQRGTGGEWLIDPEKADTAWHQRTHPGHGGKREKGKIAVPGTSRVIDPENPEHTQAGVISQDDDVLGYMESTTRLQHYKARLKEIEFAVETGELIKKDECDREIFKTYRALRDNLLSVPDRVSALLAAETDPDRVRSIIILEFEKILGACEAMAPRPPLG